MEEVSFDEICRAMEDAVRMDPSIRQKFNALVIFSVDGKDFSLNARSTGDDGDKKPDLVVKTALDTLRDLLSKKIKPQQAFMKGKLKIKGKMSLAMKLERVLNATRKHLSQKARL